ncbi:hypothetical protein Ahy_A08g037985 [Arachis hypogaea]|uniref:Uncharacterized protein n=1 Tax=Arachis hypogaea TaxID=3818 RepID=A0A445BS99_ARAHY|nr:hypothetical protein Ahy_A08g037985 [Arachis hypogaea]
MDEQNEFKQDFGDECTKGAYFSEFDLSEDTLKAAYTVDFVQDIIILNFSKNYAEKIGKYHFFTLQLAIDFYLKYSKSKEFSARKSKTFKNSIGEVYKQKFVCHRQEFREEKYYTIEKRKKEPILKQELGVKLEWMLNLWHIFYFSDEYNHDLLDTQFSAMLPAHRKMSETDIMQMMNMLKSGIRISQILGLLVSQAGGYKFVGYGPRDMYDEIARQRRQVPGDTKLEDMQLKDPQLYFKACHDSRDYSLFGDVIAFDATGVNHHNQTIVFAAALIVDKTTDTYIWLLPQLIFTMKGKTPTSIISDGDMAIRNVVRDVFSKVRYSNVENPSLTSKFRKIMLGNYEIPVFKRKWIQLVEEFGLEDKPWVNNMYEEKHMWATAYIISKFFAGFKTTSRYEGLHSVVARYVGSRYNLTNFVEHFQRCVAHLRSKEFNADYESTRGVPVMQTCIELLERFAAEVYTHEIFLLFRPFLSRAGSMRVLNIENNDDCSKYIVCKHGRSDFLWTRFEETRDIIMGLYSSYKAADEGTKQPQSCVAKSSNPYVHQTNIGSGHPSKKKRQRCSVCQMEGHKKTICPWQKDIDNNVMGDEPNGSDDGERPLIQLNKIIFIIRYSTMNINIQTLSLQSI